MVFPYIQQNLESKLSVEVLAELPYPQIVLKALLPLLLIFIFYLIPTCTSRKSLGKKLFSIRIGSKFEDGKITKKAVLIREVLIKPISLISIVGVLLIFTNSKRRALHDYICGSTVYDEL